MEYTNEVQKFMLVTVKIEGDINGMTLEEYAIKTIPIRKWLDVSANEIIMFFQYIPEELKELEVSIIPFDSMLYVNNGADALAYGTQVEEN